MKDLKRVNIEAHAEANETLPKVEVSELEFSRFSSYEDRDSRSMADYYLSPQVKPRVIVE